MKTLITNSTLLRSLGVVLVALMLNSCGAFYPYAYYYSDNGYNNAYAYRQRAEKPGKNYAVYFSEKASEYNEILGDEVVVVEEESYDSGDADKQVTIQLNVNSNPYNYGYYSWGFRPYWDLYYAYSPYVNYGYYNPFFYDQWYWGYSSYNRWGFSSWWYPYASYSYIYAPYRHNHYFNSPSRNRGRNNNDRSSYRSSRILGYGSSSSLASNSRGRVSSLRSLNNTSRSAVNATTQNRGRSRSDELRSATYSRLRGANTRSSNTNSRSNLRTRSYTPTRSSIRYTPQRSTNIKRSSTIKRSPMRSTNNNSYKRSSSSVRRSSVNSSRSYSPRPAVSKSSSSRSSSSRGSSSRSSSRKKN